MPSYTVVRKASINSAPDRVHALINDFHEWQRWSPWEALDPQLKRTYIGPNSGVGAHYAWTGNKKAGSGSMEIESSSPEQVAIAVRFLKPFKATNDTVFDIVSSGHGTEVTWTMSGRTTGFLGLMSRLYPMDKVIGPDFEKGLSQLKSVAESSD
jgi:hypothetical protein